MKFKRKCVCHPNRKADGKYRQRPFCSDCLKEMRRSKGTKNKRPTACVERTLCILYVWRKNLSRLFSKIKITRRRL